MSSSIDASNVTRIQSISHPLLGELETLSSAGQLFLAKHLHSGLLGSLPRLQQRLPFLFDGSRPNLQEFLEVREIFGKQFAIFKFYSFTLERYLLSNEKGGVKTTPEAFAGLAAALVSVVESLAPRGAFLPLLTEKLVFLSESGTIKVANPLLFDSFFLAGPENFEAKINENWQDIGRLLLRMGSLVPLQPGADPEDVRAALRAAKTKLPYKYVAFLKNFTFGIEGSPGKFGPSTRESLAGLFGPSPMARGPLEGRLGGLAVESIKSPQEKLPVLGARALLPGQNPLRSLVESAGVEVLRGPLESVEVVAPKPMYRTGTGDSLAEMGPKGPPANFGRFLDHSVSLPTGSPLETRIELRGDGQVVARQGELFGNLATSEVRSLHPSALFSQVEGVNLPHVIPAPMSFHPAPLTHPRSASPLTQQGFQQPLVFNQPPMPQAIQTQPVFQTPPPPPVQFPPVSQPPMQYPSTPQPLTLSQPPMQYPSTPQPFTSSQPPSQVEYPSTPQRITPTFSQPTLPPQYPSTSQPMNSSLSQPPMQYPSTPQPPLSAQYPQSSQAPDIPILTPRAKQPSQSLHKAPELSPISSAFATSPRFLPEASGLLQKTFGDPAQNMITSIKTNGVSSLENNQFVAQDSSFFADVAEGYLQVHREETQRYRSRSAQKNQPAQLGGTAWKTPSPAF